MPGARENANRRVGVVAIIVERRFVLGDAVSKYYRAGTALNETCAVSGIVGPCGSRAPLLVSQDRGGAITKIGLRSRPRDRPGFAAECSPERIA